jgi:hypothetical protein
MSTIVVNGVTWEVVYEIGGGLFVVCRPEDAFPKPTYVVYEAD